MKYFKFYFTAFFIAALSLCCFSCSDDDDNNGTKDPDLLETNHFDIWVSVGSSTSGMGSNETQLVKAMKSLEQENATDSIDFQGSGVNITANYYQETIIKGQYYYQVPKSEDRFVKFQIGTQGVSLIKEIPFKTNTYSGRKYTHAWIDDNTLVIMAANGDATKIIWTKLDAANMTILSEGTLNLEKLSKYSTSGIASYRASDNKILYSYCHGTSSLRTKFYMAFIDASTMNVEKTVEEDRADFMAGTAYGELLQSKSFFDANGDYYLACNTVNEGASSTTQQHGTMLRIKKGETEFDSSYAGFITPSGGKGKIITVEALASGKALLYVMDPDYTGVSGSWGSTAANCYYATLDLNTDKLTVLNVPYSKGNFSQRSVVLGNKAYIGVNPDDSAPLVYIYDIQSSSLAKGMPIRVGYSFDRIVTLQD